MRFAFWNCCKAPLFDHIHSVVDDNDVDVLILAEAPSVPDILASLNRRTERWVHSPSPAQVNTVLFVRGHTRFATPTFDFPPRLSIQLIQFPAKPSIIVAMVHLVSKLHYHDRDQMAAALPVVSAIREVEERFGHSRTIVVGDFNMNPFEPGLTDAHAFNAVMTRRAATQETRSFANKNYRFFFNPMWGHCGEDDTAPVGTFFHNPKGAQSIHWHLFDQVLVRPALLPFFPTNNVRILTSTTSGNLRNNRARPVVSDHFPLIFELTM